MTLEEAREHVGSGVVYRGEDGTITSVNDSFVFVRYGSDQHSKATSPGDLQLLYRKDPDS